MPDTAGGFPSPPWNDDIAGMAHVAGMKGVQQRRLVA